MDLSLERDSTALGSLFQQIITDMKIKHGLITTTDNQNKADKKSKNRFFPVITERGLCISNTKLKDYQYPSNKTTEMVTEGNDCRQFTDCSLLIKPTYHADKKITVNTSPLWEDFVAKASKLHACLRAAIQAIAAYLDAFQKIADAATNSRGASKEIGTALTRVCLRHKAVETRMKTFTSAIMDCLIIPLQDKIEDWKRQVVILDKEHAKEYKRCRTELKKRSSDTLRLQKKARKGQSETIQSLVDSHMQDVTMRRAELEDVERKSLRSAMIEERMRYCSFVNMLQPVVKEECEVMSELGHLQEAMQSIAVAAKEPNVLPQSSEELILESKSTINLYPESPGGNSGSQGCSNSLGSRKSSVCSISSMNSSGSSGSPGHHYQRSLSQLISPTIRLKPGESSDSGFCSSPALTLQASTATSQSHAVSTWPPHSQDVVQTTDRPHTISSAYEKGHQRPALTVYTFQNPETIMETQKSTAPTSCRPPLPVRCSSLERPLSSTGSRNNVNLIQRQCPSPIPAHITKELPQHQPTYVNMSELASMAAMKITNQQIQQQHQQIMQQPKPQHQQIQPSPPNLTPQSTSSQISSDSPTGPINQPQYSSSDLSLSGNATAAPSAMAGTTPSSGGSPQSSSQNNSPQLTNSPQTPLTGGSDNSNNKEACVDDELKITETDTNISNAANTPLNNQNLPAENEDISRCSVLEKTSMFEKLEQQQSVNNNPPPISSGRSSHSISSGDSIYSNRKEDNKATTTNDKDPDQIYEDSIQELNNLIGELDSFQREHEMKEQANRSKLQQQKNFGKDDHQQQSCIDTDSDKISVGSLNYSTQSTNASDIKLTYSDSELSRYVSESSSVGFENPTFAHFNSTDDVDSTNHHHENSGSGHITIYDHNFAITPDIDYMRQNSEIVVLRCKETSTLDSCEEREPKQRLSSFRCEQQSPQTYLKEQLEQSEKLIPLQIKSDQGTTSSDDYSLSKNNLRRIENSLIDESSPSASSMKNFKANLDEKLRSKPIVSPRPASLSGCVTRIARRSSINSTKPPPPVRRSSSVTPSHNLATPNSPNLIQQNVMNTSAESLPPPPAYLLDRTSTASPTINVAETVKALTVIRHTPASPSALRRAQNHVNTPSVQSNKQFNDTTNLFSPTNEGSVSSMYTPQLPKSHTTNTSSDNLNSSFRTTNSNSPGIYAQPKQVTKMSSFRSPSPGPQKTSSSLLAQINARLTPNKQSQHPSQQSSQVNDYGSYHHAYHESKNQSQSIQPTYSSGPNSPHHQNYVQSEQIYSRAGDKYFYGTQQQYQQSQHCDDYAPSNNEKSGSIRAKAKAEFLENLNAKLAKQGLSGRAFAVRNLINSKALPDPRLCHESLMDQIKRGATLKRNRTINDRSAPKIH